MAEISRLNRSDISYALRPLLRNRSPFASRTPNSDLRKRFCGAATALPPLSTIPIFRQRAPQISAKWLRHVAQSPQCGILRPFSEPRESARRGSLPRANHSAKVPFVRITNGETIAFQNTIALSGRGLNRLMDVPNLIDEHLGSSNRRQDCI
jgi:hypothetical protein